MDNNLLFRWFAGLSMGAAIWDMTVFTKNSARDDKNHLPQAKHRSLSDHSGIAKALR